MLVIPFIYAFKFTYWNLSLRDQRDQWHPATHMLALVSFHYILSSESDLVEPQPMGHIQPSFSWSLLWSAFWTLLRCLTQRKGSQEVGWGLRWKLSASAEELSGQLWRFFSLSEINADFEISKEQKCNRLKGPPLGSDLSAEVTACWTS